jgi:hypothetical protein
VPEGGLITVACIRNAALVLAACTGLALAPPPASTEASVPPTRCGKIEVGGKAYKVNAHRLECDFARKWSKRFLKDGDRPDGWNCQRYSREETKIAFTCRKGGKDYYAVRK